ncbi:MAG TPA: hypothetical protein ENK70_05490, partial [Methylophaga sp.]|nr:hypothetical protein [Methylophaga sp.]
KRSIPVLAYSTENNFVVDDNSYPPGLKFWIDDAKKQLESIKSSGCEQSLTAQDAWGSIQQSIIDQVSTLKSVPPDDDCYNHSDIITRGPITVPTWHQNDPFNSQTPIMTCNGSTVHAKVGCKPLAVATIMRYHEHPTSFSWSSMPYTSGNSITAAFLADIHDKIHDYDSWQPYYECGGTAVEADMGWILKNRYGYTSATETSFNDNGIKNNIIYNRPVVLMGLDQTYGGHAWVCTGYREYVHYSADCDVWTSMHYYMVWGAVDPADDGWYAYGSFNPSIYHYNTDLEMIYNIIP